jgi:hypothetical protein
MTTLAFDTLKYANKLKKVGINSIEAEAQAEALSEVMQELTKNQLATKQDLFLLKQEIYGFIVKTTIFTVTILGGLQTLFKFVHA